MPLLAVFFFQFLKDLFFWTPFSEDADWLVFSEHPKGFVNSLGLIVSDSLSLLNHTFLSIKCTITIKFLYT